MRKFKEIEKNNENQTQEKEDSWELRKRPVTFVVFEKSKLFKILIWSIYNY